jgi:hypothetical protein
LECVVKPYGSALKKEKVLGSKKMCDVKEEEVGIKPPIGHKKGCKAQRKKFIGDALWIGKRGKGPCKEKV